MKLNEIMIPAVAEVLTEGKKKAKKKVPNMYSGFRTPVAVGGAWGWGMNGVYAPGDNSTEGEGDGGDGGGGE